MTTIWLIASSTFGEAIRRKILLVFLFVALAILLMGVAFASFQPEREMIVIKSLGLGVIALAGVFISVILNINLIPNEIERRTIYTILSKPVQRYQFVCGKFLGGVLTVLANIALMGMIFLILVAIKANGTPEFGRDISGIIRGIVMIFCQLTLVSAVALFFSVFVPPVFNFFLTFGFWLLGSTPLIGSMMNDDNPLVAGLSKALHVFIPNFSNFNIQNPIIDIHQHVAHEPIYVTWSILYTIVYTAILLMAGTSIFDRREV